MAFETKTKNDRSKDRQFLLLKAHVRNQILLYFPLINVNLGLGKSYRVKCKLDSIY